MRVKAVRHDAYRAGGRAYELAEAARGEQAFEDETVGERCQPALGVDVDAPGDGGGRMMQAAAMRGVEGADALGLPLERARRKPRIGAALGAVAMQDIDVEAGGKALQPAVGREVAGADLPGHGAARHAERAEIRQARKRARRILPAGLGVADDADLKPKLGLALHQIVDVPEQASDRRPQAMENTERGGHGAANSGLGGGSPRFRRTARPRK